MRKKITALVLALCLAVSAFGLISCGDKSSNQPTLAVKYNTRYIRDNDDVRSNDTYKQIYLVFTSGNTGEYHYYYVSSSLISESPTKYIEYTIKFKYTVLDSDGSTALCFYDSITYGEHHTGEQGSRNNWSMTIVVSENVLVLTTSSGYVYFINENYLDNGIPNYKK